ncbi:Aste57867_22962 [Aphanomyces stellatus]|uniref:Aste57867_22962 protein n=1 Tax=Aphanomyces stellatus TaxID=120398 RepID=A0A485LN18_9STRA|nr:hypothetical protein As57867_022891 [Aphanomyces stellatus]VFT99612.1 Aste57867_22962 [Aphanomyces stellatus]
MWSGSWWSASPWVVKTREKSTYQERQESGTGLTIRHPWTRVLTAVVLLGLNCLAHFINPVALSRASVSIPVVGTAINFLLREKLADDTTLTFSLRVSLAIATLLLSCILSRAIIFPMLRRRFTMFSGGHAELGRLEAVKTSGGLVAAKYRTVHAFANGGRPYTQEVYIGSLSQGSWVLMIAVVPFLMTLGAILYNAFAPTALAVTSVLPVRYIDMYPGVRGFSIVTSILILFSTIDVMLQDSPRCEALYDGWLGCVRSVWRHPWVRIPLFWLVFGGGIAFAILGLPLFQQLMVNLVLDHLSPDFYFMESWRAVVSGAVLMLDLVVLMQDWDFPTMASPKHISIPGLATDVLSLRLGRFHLAFTCKWIVTTFVLLMLPVDIWTYNQQITYLPSSYGHIVLPNHQIAAVTNTSLLDAAACGPFCYNLTTANQASEASIGRYFGWPMEDKFPAVCLVLYMLFLFVRMVIHEDGRFIVSSQMQGVKEENYRLQLEATALPVQALLDLERMAEIKRLYSLRKHADDICVGLAMFGLIMMLVQLRCIWQVSVVFSAKTYPSNALSVPGQTYSVLIFISTIFLVVELLHRSHLTVDILKLRNKLPEKTSKWRHPKIRLWLVVELLVNLAIVPPFVIGYFSVEEFQMPTANGACDAPMVLRETNKCYLVFQYAYETFGMLMFLRLYWLVRLVRNHSGFYGQRVDFIGSLNNVSTDSPLWHFRAIFYHNPVFAFLTCTLLIWIATAVGVSVMERPLPSPLDSELTAMWMIIVTMATVGYGDYVPRTYAGRTITVLGGILGGVIVISMLTSLFMGSLQTTRGEEKVLHVVRFKRWQRRRLNASVNLIGSAWKLTKLRRAGKPIDDANARLFKYMQQVRELRLGAVTEGEDTAGLVRQWHRDSISPILDRVNEQRNDTVDDLEKKIHQIRDLAQAVKAIRATR